LQGAYARDSARFAQIRARGGSLPVRRSFVHLFRQM